MAAKSKAATPKDQGTFKYFTAQGAWHALTADGKGLACGLPKPEKPQTNPGWALPACPKCLPLLPKK